MTKIALSLLSGVLFIVLSIETVVEILSSLRYEHLNDVSSEALALGTICFASFFQYFTM